jgi:hypothetical protein
LGCAAFCETMELSFEFFATAMADAPPLSPAARLMREARASRGLALRRAAEVFSPETASAERSLALDEARAAGLSPLHFADLRLPAGAVADPKNPAWSFFAALAAVDPAALPVAARLWPRDALDALEAAGAVPSFPANISLEGVVELARLSQAARSLRSDSKGPIDWGAWSRALARSPRTWALAERFLREGASRASDLEPPSAQKAQAAFAALIPSLAPHLAWKSLGRSQLAAQSDAQSQECAEIVRRLLAQSPAMGGEPAAQKALARFAAGLRLADGRAHPVGLALLAGLDASALAGNSLSSVLGAPLARDLASSAVRSLREIAREQLDDDRIGRRSLDAGSRAALMGNFEALWIVDLRLGKKTLDFQLFAARDRRTINPAWILWDNRRQELRDPRFGEELQKQRIERSRQAIFRHCFDPMRAKLLVEGFLGPTPAEEPPRLIEALSDQPAQAIEMAKPDLASLVCAAWPEGQRPPGAPDPQAIVSVLRERGEDLEHSAIRYFSLVGQPAPHWLCAASDSCALSKDLARPAPAEPALAPRKAPRL